MLRRWFGRPTMTDIDRALPAGPRRRRRRRTLVVIASDPRQVTRLRIAETRWRRARVVSLVGETRAGLHRELSRLSGVDVVVDARGSSGSQQVDAFRACFFHLVRGGAWVALRTPRAVRRREALVDLARRLAHAPRSRDVEETWHEHARATAGVRTTPEVLVVRKR